MTETVINAYYKCYLLAQTSSHKVEFSASNYLCQFSFPVMKIKYFLVDFYVIVDVRLTSQFHSISLLTELLLLMC